MACRGGVIEVWDGEEWQKVACSGCENCIVGDQTPTDVPVSLIERYSTQMADGSVVVDDLTGIQKEFIDRYAAQAVLYAEPTLHPDGSITDGPTSIHESLEAHVQGDTPDDTSETPTGEPRIPQDVMDQGAQAMTEWVIKQTALAQKAVQEIAKIMDTPHPVPNRRDKRRSAQMKQRYINQMQRGKGTG